MLAHELRNPLGAITNSLAIIEPAVECACEKALPHHERKAQTSQTSLPPRALRLRADPVCVRQMLANLLDNASKFTAQGGSVVLSPEAVTMFAQLEGACKGSEFILRLPLARG